MSIKKRRASQSLHIHLLCFLYIYERTVLKKKFYIHNDSLPKPSHSYSCAHFGLLAYIKMQWRACRLHKIWVQSNWNHPNSLFTCSDSRVFVVFIRAWRRTRCLVILHKCFQNFTWFYCLSYNKYLYRQFRSSLFFTRRPKWIFPDPSQSTASTLRY